MVNCVNISEVAFQNVDYLNELYCVNTCLKKGFQKTFTFLFLSEVPQNNIVFIFF